MGENRDKAALSEIGNPRAMNICKSSTKRRRPVVGIHRSESGPCRSETRPPAHSPAQHNTLAPPPPLPPLCHTASPQSPPQCWAVVVGLGWAGVARVASPRHRHRHPEDHGRPIPHPPHDPPSPRPHLLCGSGAVVQGAVYGHIDLSNAADSFGRSRESSLAR